jgi:hypothetical protein
MKYGYEEIGWKTWRNERSTSSKIHICKEGSDICLCGIRIPTDYSVEVGSSVDYGYGNCKKCQKAYDKTED